MLTACIWFLDSTAAAHSCFLPLVLLRIHIPYFKHAAESLSTELISSSPLSDWHPECQSHVAFARNATLRLVSMLNTHPAHQPDFMKVDPVGKQPIKLLIMKIIKKKAYVLLQGSWHKHCSYTKKYRFENSGSHPKSKSKPANRKTVSCPGNLPHTKNQSSRHSLIIQPQQQLQNSFQDKKSSSSNPHKLCPWSSSITTVAIHLIRDTFYLCNIMQYYTIYAILKCKQMLGFRVNMEWRQLTLPRGR